jgi:signal peptidase II
VLLAIAGVVLALDLWTKRWATATLAGQPSVPVIGELVRFTYTRNPGVAFGIGNHFPFPYYLFSIAAALLILYLFFRQRVPSTARRLALALILGGALGNLVDRVTAGEVVDFIEIGWSRWHWPVFNVADSAVTIGVVLFALALPKRDGVHEAGGSGAGAEGAASPGPPPSSTGTHERDAGAGPLRSSAQHGGAAGSLPGRGADGPFA